MGRKCVVPYCKTGYAKNNEKLSLFAIPKDSVKEYNQAIPRGDRLLTEKDHVCEKHFKPECIIREQKTKCFTIPLKIPKLQSGSLPTIFPVCLKNKTYRKKYHDIINDEDTEVQTLQNSDAEICQQVIKREDAGLEIQISDTEVQTLQNSDAEICQHVIKQEDAELKIQNSDAGNVEEEIRHQIIKLEQEDAELKTLNADVGTISNKLLPTCFNHCTVDGDICHQIMRRNDADMEAQESDAGPVYNCGVDGVKVEQMANEEIGISKTPFETLWSNHEVLILPSNSWYTHLIPNGDNNLIAVMKLSPFSHNILVEKKVVINKNFEVDCYIFEHSSNLAQNAEITDIGQLNNFLFKFDSLSSCCGSFAEVPDDYKPSVYYKDAYCQSWRHRECNFIIEEKAASRYYTANCNHCKKILSALAAFCSTLPKKILDRRERQKRQKRESRLKTKLEAMSAELQHYRETSETNCSDCSN